ncbi:MAG: class I SAM-dependent methyltransferase [bacterium]|nr:class I SAM-dependent methyltransferase [bacterium]
MSIEFLVGDATNVPFKNEYFDTIVSLGMFEYLKGPTPFLSEINRILKPSGTLLFSCHNRNLIGNSKKFQFVLRPTLILKSIYNLYNFFRPETKNVDEKDYYGFSLQERERLWHVVAHDLKEINKFLELNGLKLVGFRTFGFFISDKLFRLATKIQKLKLRDKLFASSVFINRFLGKFTLTKVYGGVFIIKSEKIGGIKNDSSI